MEVARLGFPVRAARSTSLLPSQTVAKVGRTSMAASTCVRPPRMKVVSSFGLAPASALLVKASCTQAPGTATLLSRVGMGEERRAHSTDATRDGGKIFVRGGGQPGF